MLSADFEVELRNNLIEFAYGVTSMSASPLDPTAAVKVARIAVVTLEGRALTVEMSAATGYSVVGGQDVLSGDQDVPSGGQDVPSGGQDVPAGGQDVAVCGQVVPERSFEAFDHLLRAYSPGFVAAFNNQLTARLFAAAAEGPGARFQYSDSDSSGGEWTGDLPQGEDWAGDEPQ